MTDPAGNGRAKGEAATSTPRAGTEEGAPLEAMGDLQSRANEAGIRLLSTEMEVASSLAARFHHARDAKERTKILREVRSTLELVTRLTETLEFADGQREAMRGCIEQLQQRLHPLPGRPAKISAPPIEPR